MNPEQVKLELPNNEVIEDLIVPNGINKELFTKDYGLDRNPYRFCYTSNYVNGIEPLLKFCWPKIVEKIPHAEFHIYYGIEETKINEEGVELLKELFLQDGVYEHGRVSYKDIAKEMQMSSFLLYYTSSPSECDCLSIMEALSSGCIPVIWNQNIFSKFNGLQVSNDPRQKESYEILAEKLVQLMNGDNERKDAIERFKNSPSIIDWEFCANVYMSYFTGVNFEQQQKQREMEILRRQEYAKHQEEELKRMKEIQLRKQKYNLPEAIILNSYVDSDNEDETRKVSFAIST
tara:strand:- start:31 stop:900 length:870 start_codon:yes stop_codon:yes gene_type:complete